MKKNVLNSCLILFLVLLCSCTAKSNTQEVIRVYDNSIYQNVKPLLLADFTKHGIVTEDLPTFNPFAMLNKEWGFVTARNLYEKMSLSFRYPSKEESRYWTFANIHGKEEIAETTMYSHGFVQEYGLERTTVSLLGDLYWNSDNARDWLVFCRIEDKQTKNKLTKNDIRHAREYYLIITDRTGKYWQASPILIRDLNIFTHGQESYIHRNLTKEKQLQLEPSLSVDFEAGQDKLLQAPKDEKHDKKNKKQGNNKELNEQSLSE